MDWNDLSNWQETHKDEIVTPVVGVSFLPNYPDNLLQLHTLYVSKVMILAEIRRNPNNEFDTNACEVWAYDEQIGHLPRDKAAELAPLIDSGIEFHAEINSVGFANNDPSKPGAIVRIRKNGR